MALVRDIEVDWAAKGKMQPTLVDAKVKVISTLGPDPIVQIDTFGSSERKFEGKLSQTLQLDRRAAEELMGILKRAYRL